MFGSKRVRRLEEQMERVFGRVRNLESHVKAFNVVLDQVSKDIKALTDVTMDGNEITKIIEGGLLSMAALEESSAPRRASKKKPKKKPLVRKARKKAAVVKKKSRVRK